MDKMTKVRTVALIITWINMILANYGFETIPVLSDETIAMLLAGASTMFAWFYNNYVTAKGKAQKEVLKDHGLSK